MYTQDKTAGRLRAGVLSVQKGSGDFHAHSQKVL